MKYYVYGIFLPSGENLYIGQTTNPESREADHRGHWSKFYQFLPWDFDILYSGDERDTAAHEESKWIKRMRLINQARFNKRLGNRITVFTPLSPCSTSSVNLEHASQ